MSAFNGVQVFAATMVEQRQSLGEVATRWITEARTRRVDFEVVDIVIRQSSDDAFHCITICIFYKETIVPRKKAPYRDY